MNKQEYMRKVFRMFFFYWLITAVGVFLGQYLPSFFHLPLFVLSIVLLFLAAFLQNRTTRLPKLIYISVALILGLTAYAGFARFLDTLGPSLLYTIVLSIVIIFGLLGIFGYKLNLDLRKFGTYLFVALIVLLVVSLVAMVIPGSSILSLVLSGAGLLLFSLFTIYDFNRIANTHGNPDNVVYDAFSLYINLFNMIIDALNIASFR